jgi:hypothetical protein
MSNIPTVWATAKADLATAQAALLSAQAALNALEADCDALYALGAGDVVDWLRTKVSQTLLGYQPRASAGGGIAPQCRAVWAAQPGTRDQVANDRSLISSTTTGAANGLS